MKVKSRLLALLLIIMMLAGFSSAYAADEGYPTAYTYNYDYWGDVRESPDAYRVDQVLYGTDLGLEVAMKKPQNLFVRNQDLYVCDTGNNRILQLRKTGNTFALVRIIDTIQGCDVTTFNNPNDLFVDEQDNIYICDTNNERIVMVDKDLNFIKAFTKPDDPTFDQGTSFLPHKLVVDVSGRVFCLATNINKGMVKFESDTTFTGFVGANKVSYNLYDYIWKRFLSTEAQRAQQESFVPTEYRNIYIDDESFIYATNTSFSEYDLLYDVAQPIRRLNGIGNDILIKNDRYPPIGDLYWEEQSDQYGPSKLVDITVLGDDIYVALDRTRGRLFGYDSQGIMLWAFGTKGNSEGAFNAAIALEHMGKDLIVLDENECNITVFTPTEYGSLIYKASEAYLKGDYDGSAALWEEVLKFNANYNLAFIGIGRALLRQDQYKEAMDYFEMARDRDNYGRAFRLYRKDWVEQNIGWMIAVVVCVLVIPLIIKQVKKTRWEVELHERSKVGK
ncbi:MAG: hypothetical protein E7319_00360 [Clostridiales bacterium]|nr:hypothetical protein [Clostridiales bacterium]